MNYGLDPCPLCGGESTLCAPYVPTEDGTFLTWPSCTVCGLKGKSERANTADEVIALCAAKWNSRVTNPSGFLNAEWATAIDSRDGSEYDQRQGVPNV